MREKRGYNMNIKEVEKVTGLTKANIRFYEEEGLVCPKRNEQNNYRIYTEVEIKRLQEVKKLRLLGISIPEIQKIYAEELSLQKAMERRLKEIREEERLLQETRAICQEAIPTPAVAYLTRALRLDAGVVISGSHNPYDDNGIKFFSGEGTKLPDAVELGIEDGQLDAALCRRVALLRLMSSLGAPLSGTNPLSARRVKLAPASLYPFACGAAARRRFFLLLNAYRLPFSEIKTGGPAAKGANSARLPVQKALSGALPVSFSWPHEKGHQSRGTMPKAFLGLRPFSSASSSSTFFSASSISS